MSIHLQTFYLDYLFFGSCFSLDPLLCLSPWSGHCNLSSVQSLSRVRLIATPWIAARQASLSITNSRSSPKLTSIESMMPSSHLILCRPLLLLPPIPPSIRVLLLLPVNSYRRLNFSVLNLVSASLCTIPYFSSLWASLLRISCPVSHCPLLLT